MSKLSNFCEISKKVITVFEPYANSQVDDHPCYKLHKGGWGSLLHQAGAGNVPTDPILVSEIYAREIGFTMSESSSRGSFANMLAICKL